MRKISSQNGFSLLELMIGTTLLVVIFGSSFQLLAKMRTASSEQSISGSHIYFETFAANRLRIYFSKLMQWTTHMSAYGDAGKVSNFCKETRRFAFASGKMDFNFAPKASLAEDTLGADIRMSLSTLTRGQIDSDGLTNKNSNTDYLWGAIVPFASLNSNVDGLKKINLHLYDLCADKGTRVKSGKGAELCHWVDACTASGGVRVANENMKPDPTVDGLPILAFSKSLGKASGGKKVLSESHDLTGKKGFRMCFALVGNLFSKGSASISSSVARMSRKSDNVSGESQSEFEGSSLVGLVIATAKFVDVQSGRSMTCNQAVHEMNRNLHVNLQIFSALNGNKKYTERVQYFKTVKDIVSEKYGVSIPNCNYPSREVRVNGAGEKICIADPLWNYKCEVSCASKI